MTLERSGSSGREPTSGPVIADPLARSSPSTLEAGAGDAFDDVALEEQEDQHEREAAEQRGGHDIGVADAVGTLHGREADLNGHEVRVRQHEQGPEQVV